MDALRFWRRRIGSESWKKGKLMLYYISRLNRFRNRRPDPDPRKTAAGLSFEVWIEVESFR